MRERSDPAMIALASLWTRSRIAAMLSPSKATVETTRSRPT